MSLIAYFQAALPLTLAQLAVPPISTFELMRREVPPDSVAWLIEPIRAVTPKEMLKKEFVHSLLLPNIDYDSFLENPERVLNYRLVTSLFVHYDYNHLLGNLMMLLSYGVPLYHEKGILFFYNVYFTSGLVCAFPFYSIFTQSIERYRQPVSPQTPVRLVQSMFQEALNPLQNSSPDIVHCGSSAAICGILGGSTVVLTKHLSLSLIKIVKLIQESPSDKDISDSFMREAVDCCLVSWGLWQAYKIIRAEFRGYQRQSRSVFSLNFSRLLDPSSWKVANHEGHIHGFVIGVIMTLISYQS